MGCQVETVLEWLNAIKTDSGRNNFLELDLKRAIELAKSIRREQVTEADVKLIRLLRNCVPLGERAVTAILEAGLVPAVVLSLAPKRTDAPEHNKPNSRSSTSRTSTAGPCPDGVDTSYLAACAQLLANLASSGASGGAEIWSHCFPAAFLSLIVHPSAQVHDPATLALYACCRLDICRSRALCAVPEVHSPFSSTATTSTTVPSDSPTTAAATATAATVPMPTPGPPSPIAAAAAAAAPEPAGAVAAVAVRRIWETLLDRLLVSESHAASRAEQHSGGGGGAPEWTSVLCGCVALRQGLLGSVLTLLLAPPPPPPPLRSAHNPRGGDGVGGGDVQTWLEPAAASDAATAPSAAAVESMTAISAAAAAAPSGAYSAAAAAAAAAAAPSVEYGSAFCPVVLLHVVAQELYELRGGGAVDIGGWADDQQCSELHRENTTAAAAAVCALQLEPSAPPPPPPSPRGPEAAGLVCLSAAAGGCPSAGLQLQMREVEVAVSSVGKLELGPAGTAVTANSAAAVAGNGHGGGPVSTGGGGGVTPVAALPPAARPLASALLHVAAVVEATARCLAAGGTGSGKKVNETEAVLEAGLEVLKSATQREDGCRAIIGGDIGIDMDLVEWLLCKHGTGPRGGEGGGGGGGGVLELVLGMLAAMQPAAARRHQANGGGGGAATAAASGSAAGGDRPVAELPYTLKALAAGFPTRAAYMGYRGDLVSVLANGAFRRPLVVSELLSGGGLELLLAQTHLDEHSPLAREWALWGVRNMCEVSEEVQGRIAGLELQTAVETPELRQLGLKLELDKTTGKLKMSRTEAAKTFLEGGPNFGKEA